MRFRAIAIAVLVATVLVVGGFIVHSLRPEVEVGQPTPDLIRATGKCAECHRRETAAVVHEYEMSVHAAEGVNCLDCHQVADGQEPLDHRGFTIAANLTAANCAECHATEYGQYLRSRHAAPAWAAVRGAEPFTAEQVAHGERFHPGAVDRPPNDLAVLEGEEAMTVGCQGCHDIGRPNPDGSIGTCTDCHARHAASIRLARTPETCGQCHMGPDHAQIEIYNESKHGVIFNAQKHRMNLSADPKTLSTRDMPVPTCTTCHMSGLDGMQVTHDPSGRLSYYLFAAVSDKRPNYARNQAQMQELCLKCHTEPHVDQYYEEAEAVVRRTNKIVLNAENLMGELREAGLLTTAPFDEPIEFTYFDLWHYYGRTAKHGAFMGGADFVQWHGFYELTAKTVEMRHTAEELRRRAGESVGESRGGQHGAEVGPDDSGAGQPGARDADE